MKHRRRPTAEYRRTYASWKAMKRRCYDSEHYWDYHRYGGRGIKVCDRWLESVDNFIADMGYRPEGLTLDRIDGSGNYEPSNCRWATPSQQIDNSTSPIRCRPVTFNGETRGLREWSRITGIPNNTLSTRLSRGLPLEQVFARRESRTGVA
jgi:hypothetical protein